MRTNPLGETRARTAAARSPKDNAAAALALLLDNVVSSSACFLYSNISF